MAKRSHSHVRKTIEQILPRIRCIPVDTNVLLKNVARDVFQWPRPTGLRHLVGSGVLRPYAAVHVRDEVEEKMDTWMEDRGRNPRLARRIWRESYLPHLWLVDVGTLGANDPRVQILLQRDPDDAPTAALASVLGVRVLSEDTDLVDYDLASGQPWLDVIFAVGWVTQGEAVDFGLAAAVSMSVQTAIEMTRAVGSLASTPSGRRIALTGGLLVGSLILFGVLICEFDTDKRQWLIEKVRTVGTGVASFGRVSLEAYTRLSRKRFEAMTRLGAAAVTTARPLSDLDQAARMLAAQRNSLSTKELARRLWGYTRVPTPVARYLHDQLSVSPAFVEIAPGEWQFGRRALN